MSRSKYETNVLPFLDKISEWAKQGATGKEIAKKLGIAYSSFKLYLAKAESGDEAYSALSACYRQACVVADDEVEAALFKLACGYTVSLQKTFKVRRVEYDPETGRRIAEYEELVTGQDEAHVAANAQAQMFWLANRRRDRWQYKPETGDKDGDAPGDTSGVIELAAVIPPPEEAQA